MESRNDIKYSLGLYSGSLIALDSIAKLGISVDVKTYDTYLNLDKSLKEVAVQAASYQVPVIAPFASQSDISLNNVFFSNPSDDVLRKRMLDYVEAKKADQNIVIIADEKNKLVAEKIMLRFPLAKKAELIEEEKNISLNIQKLWKPIILN